MITYILFQFKTHSLGFVSLSQYTESDADVERQKPTEHEKLQSASKKLHRITELEVRTELFNINNLHFFKRKNGSE